MKLNLKLAAVFFLAASILTPAFAQGDGPDTFKSKCAPCHGADGQANTQAGKALKAASFKTLHRQGAGCGLFAVVKSGKGKMPAWTGKLTDVRSSPSWPYIRTLQK